MEDIELIYRKYYKYVKSYVRSLCFDGFTKDEMIEIIRNLELN